MRQLSHSGQQMIDDIARRHGFSVDAVLSMLQSVINGNGSMAQFSHPEFSGSGQWMSGGMTMVSDMFNNYLKGRVDGLCSELSRLLANQPDLLRSGSFQSQSQGGQSNNILPHQGGQQQSGNNGSQQQGNHFSNQNQNQNQNQDQNQNQNQNQQHSNSNGQGGGNPANNAASLFIAPAPGTGNDWWPADLRFPNSTGAQNGVRYAHFAQAHRLVIEVHGKVTVYDTQDHQIGGFSQQQSIGGSLSFTSQYGLIDVSRLPIVSVDGVLFDAYVQGNMQGNVQGNRQTDAAPAMLNQAPPMNQAPIINSGPLAPSGQGTATESDIFAMIEKLADLRSKSLLSEDEFAKKKTELLARL